MTPSQLKDLVEETSPYFFDRKTMKFHGDTMRNYGVCSTEINGEPCWELFRKRPVKFGITSSTYFRKSDGKRVRK